MLAISAVFYRHPPSPSANSVSRCPRAFMPLTFVILSQLRQHEYPQRSPHLSTIPIQGTLNISVENCNSLDKSVARMTGNKDANTLSKMSGLSFYFICLCYISCSSQLVPKETGPFWFFLSKLMAGFVHVSICLLPILHFLGQQKI